MLAQVSQSFDAKEATLNLDAVPPDPRRTKTTVTEQPSNTACHERNRQNDHIGRLMHFLCERLLMLPLRDPRVPLRPRASLQHPSLWIGAR
jgi:hypothetical protein